MIVQHEAEVGNLILRWVPADCGRPDCHACENLSYLLAADAAHDIWFAFGHDAYGAEYQEELRRILAMDDVLFDGLEQAVAVWGVPWEDVSAQHCRDMMSAYEAAKPSTIAELDVYSLDELRKLRAYLKVPIGLRELFLVQLGHYWRARQ